MTNEEFQKIMLGEFDKINKRFDSLETKVDGLGTKVGNLEGQVKENTQFIKSLMHRTEELDAKFDGLLNTTMTKEAIQCIEEKVDKTLATQTIQGESINILALRQLNSESEIEAFKKAK